MRPRDGPGQVCASLRRQPDVGDCRRSHRETARGVHAFLFFICRRESPACRVDSDTDRVYMCRVSSSYNVFAALPSYFSLLSPFSLSSTHRLTAFRLSLRIQTRLHLASLASLPSSHILCASSVLGRPGGGFTPHWSYSTMIVPAQFMISSSVVSKSKNQSLGSGMRRRRVVRSMDATARVCGGCIAYSGVRRLR